MRDVQNLVTCEVPRYDQSELQVLPRQCQLGLDLLPVLSPLRHDPGNGL